MVLLYGLSGNSTVVTRLTAKQNGPKVIEDDAEAESFLKSQFSAHVPNDSQPVKVS